MKNFEIKKEIWIWLIMILPMAYLYYVWNSLPELVPTHWGMSGKPDDWSHKHSLIYMLGGLITGIYLLFTVIPVIDPKGKISAMGNKYFLFKLFMMLFMSAICFFIIQSAVSTKIGIEALFVIIGALFAFLGNYMQTVKPNYFIGIRTPWTLESENVWRKTHRLGGRLYFVTGIVAMILPFFMKRMEVIFLMMVIVASVVPMVYSYVLFRQEKNAGAGGQ